MFKAIKHRTPPVETIARTLPQRLNTIKLYVHCDFLCRVIPAPHGKTKTHFLAPILRCHSPPAGDSKTVSPNVPRSAPFASTKCSETLHTRPPVSNVLCNTTALRGSTCARACGPIAEPCGS